MLLLFNEESTAPPDPAVMATELARWEAFGQDAAKVATQVAGDALQPSGTATVVSVRNGKRITTDGPFIETKEQLGGYYVFDCENLDVALDLASKVPWAPSGHIEVRPIMEFN
jgi:hypothetical protein